MPSSLEPRVQMSCSDLLAENFCKHHGWLRAYKQKGPSFFNNGKNGKWVRYYTVVSAGSLYFYTNPSANKPSEAFCLHGYHVITRIRSGDVPLTPDLGPVFKIIHLQPSEKKRTHFYATTSEQEIKDWIAMIQEEMILINQVPLNNTHSPKSASTPPKRPGRWSTGMTADVLTDTCQGASDGGVLYVSANLPSEQQDGEDGAYCHLSGRRQSSEHIYDALEEVVGAKPEKPPQKVDTSINDQCNDDVNDNVDDDESDYDDNYGEYLDVEVKTVNGNGFSMRMGDDRPVPPETHGSEQVKLCKPAVPPKPRIVPHRDTSMKVMVWEECEEDGDESILSAVEKVYNLNRHSSIVIKEDTGGGPVLHQGGYEETVCTSEDNVPKPLPRRRKSNAAGDIECEHCEGTLKDVLWDGSGELAHRTLEQLGVEGVFMVRNSSRDTRKVLVVYLQGCTRNYYIYKRDRDDGTEDMYLDAKDPRFRSLCCLLRHYHSNVLPNRTGNAYLRQPYHNL